MASGFAWAWIESRTPSVLWERRSGSRAQSSVRIALVPDRDGDGVSELAAVFATDTNAAVVDGSCAIYSGASGVELFKRSMRELEPERIVWISADERPDSLLGAWLEDGTGTRNGFVARVALETGVRTPLVSFEALAPRSLGEWADGALVRLDQSSLAVVDHAARAQSGRLRIIDLRDGREVSSHTGDELGFAFDSVRTAWTDSGQVEWLALSHHGNRLVTLDAEFQLRASWTVGYLVDALLVPDLDADGMPDVVAALIEPEHVELLCAYSGASGAVLWKEQHDDILTNWGASMETVVASQGAEPWIAVSGPTTFLDSRHDDAGRIDVYDLAHPKRQRVVPCCARIDFLGGQVLWDVTATDQAARRLYATAVDFESREALVLAHAIELP